MKIDKEKFNKLKQLDRIEFRQKEDRIKSWEKDSWGYPFLKGFLISLAFYILLLPQGYNAFGINFIVDITVLLRASLTIFSTGIVLGYIFDIIKYFIRKKELGILYEDYFVMEVKKK